MMQHLILPIAYEYNPELIIVSINFYSIIDKTHNGGTCATYLKIISI